MAVHITEQNFEDEVLKSELPVMVDFGATWCGPCRMIAPFMDQLSDEYAGKAKVAKVDVDECGNIAAQFGIRNVPTVLFFKNGAVVEKHVGGAPKAVFEEKLKKFI